MGAHESTRMAAAKKMVRSGRADMHRAAELCGVSYSSLHASITREDRMSGKRSYCGHCAHYREDAPNATSGRCPRSRPTSACASASRRGASPSARSVG